MRISTGFALGLLFLIAPAATGQEGEKEEDGIVLPRPDGIDDAVWERLRKDYQKEKEKFLRLLVALEEHRIDYAGDGLKDILGKQSAIREVLAEHSQETLAGMVQPEYFALNFLLVRNATAPRLSGRVIRVGPEAEYKEFGRALGDIRSGDLVRLGEGEYRLFFPGSLNNIAIVGRGAALTRVTLCLRRADRIRIEGVKIDCRNNEFIDLREGGSIHLKNCTVFGYNSGAGGSNAVSGSDAVMLVEGCTFEGMTGRAAGGSGGDAFDLRGENFLYARNTKFIDNREIIRATFPCVFDACTTENSSPWHFGIMPYGPGNVFLRKNKAKVSSPRMTVEFIHATDDKEFIEFVLGEREEIDARSRRLAGVLKIERNLPYWIGLLLHEREDVRRRAAKKIEALTGESVVIERDSARDPAEADLDRWIRELDHDEFNAREQATRRLMKAGEAARKKLEEIGKKGSMEQRVRARRILSSLGAKVAIRHEMEFARLMQWFEENRSALTWDDKAKKYVKKR